MHRHLTENQFVSSARLVSPVQIAIGQRREAHIASASDQMPTSMDPSTVHDGLLQLEDEEGRSMDKAVWGILLVLFIVIGLANIVGNVCTLVAFIRDTKLRVVSNFYICNLAITDLVVGLTSIPIYSVYTLSGYHWSLGRTACKVWLVVDYLLCAESSLTIILISLDRLLMVKLGPGPYQRHITPNRTVAVLMISWTLAFLLYGPAIIGTDIWRGFSTVEDGNCDVEFSDIFLYVVIACILEFCIPLLFISISNAALYWDIHKRAMSFKTSIPDTVHPKDSDASILRDMRNLKRDRKAARTLFLLVFAFMVCWSPYSLTTIFYSICGNSCVDFHMYELFTWLLWLNSSLNPYLYAYSNIRIRDHFKRYLFPCEESKPRLRRRVYVVSKKHPEKDARLSNVHSTSFARI